MYIEGELNADENGNPKTFSRNDGSAGASYEITAQTVKFLGGRGSSSGESDQAPPPPAEEEIPS